MQKIHDVLSTKEWPWKIFIAVIVILSLLSGEVLESHDPRVLLGKL